MSASRMITGLIGAFGGGAVGRMLGGRTGGMIGSVAGSMLSRNMGSGGRGGIGSLLGGLMGGGDKEELGVAAAEMDDADAMILIKAMCNAAKADGRVDDDEVEAIVSRAGDLNAEDEELLRTELNSPLDLAAFIAEVPAEMATDVYAASLLPIEIDTASEVTYLKELASGLGLSGTQTAAIHEELGLR